MKHEKLFSFLWACTLAFAVSFGAVGSVVTAFHMDVSLISIALWCAAASAFCGACYSLPLGLLPLSAFALISGFFWQQGALRISFESLLYRLSRQYHQAYDWGIIKLNYLTADDMELHLWLILCMLGVLIAMGVSWTVCRKKPAIPGLLPAGVLLGSCLVVTDTVPSTPFLFLLFFGTVMLLLTGTVRRQDSTRGNRLSAMLALPVALTLLILFAAIPKNNYRGQEPVRRLADRILDSEPVSQLLGRVSEVGTTGSSVDSSMVNLKTVGVRLESNAEIMQVLTDYDTTLYLRGRALDSYDGETWTDSGAGTDGLYWPSERLTNPGGEVMITTRYAHRMLYLPYYVKSIDMNEVTRGVENSNKLTQYSFSCDMPLPDGSSILQNSGNSANQAQGDLRNYLHLSDSVRKWAVPLAEEITAGKTDPYEKAQAIRDYVRTSAKYDTNTYRMPSGSKDFVRWFLEDSDTGYCVHFASAATVLLQASGIPARYVTGYSTTADDGILTVVRAKDAHAWTEFWLPGYGWTVLEATPPDESDDTAFTQTSPTSDTEPAQTRPTQSKDETKPEKADQATSIPKTEPAELLGYLWIGLLGMVIVALVIGQRCIRLRLRRKHLLCDTANQSALAYWQELAYLSRLTGEAPDRTLFDLAQKAKFSQHAITQTELSMFKTALSDAHAVLRKRSVFHQLYYRHILVIY